MGKVKFHCEVSFLRTDHLVASPHLWIYSQDFHTGLEGLKDLNRTSNGIGAKKVVWPGF